MAYAPDYGLWLKNQGADEGFVIDFVSFRLDHISAVEPDLFTTMANIPFGDDFHALTMDFDFEILQAIIPYCTDETADEIVEWANNLSEAGSTLQLPVSPIFAVTMKLGELQSNNEESYVPLVTQKIYGYED